MFRAVPAPKKSTTQVDGKGLQPEDGLCLTSGAYLAEVNVSIVDAGNKVVLDTLAEGPWFLARLPPGTYQVNASYRTNVEHRTVAVGADPQHGRIAVAQ